MTALVLTSDTPPLVALGELVVVTAEPAAVAAGVRGLPVRRVARETGEPRDTIL